MKNSWVKEDGRIYDVERFHADYALNAFKNDPEYKKYHASLVESGGFSNSSDGMHETAIEYALFKKGWIRLQEITVYKNNVTVGALGIHIGNLSVASKAFYAIQKLLKDAEGIIIDVSNSMLPEDENLATREQNFTFGPSQLSQATALLRKHIRKNKIEAAIKDQLYHSTNIFAAVNILTDGKFRLRPTVSTKTDNVLDEAKFFISFSREKANDFLRRSLTSGMVTFVLDRDKLLQGRKKTAPIDYWGQRGKPGHGLGNAEAEERLNQDKPFLEFKTKPFIDSIHVYMGDYLRDKEVSKYDLRALNTFKMLTSLKFLAKPYGIKVYVYENKTAFLMQMAQKTVKSGVVAQSYKRLIEQLYPKAKIEIDNPGGEWLASKQREAEKDVVKPDALYQKKLRGAVTATIKSIELPINFLKSINISGANGEKPTPGNPKYDSLISSVGKLGNSFNSKKHPILIRVNMDGKPFIMDGNTRYAYAQNFNEPFIWAEIQWVNGGEEAKDSTFSPANVQKAATDSMREWINYRGRGRNERKTKSFERISSIIQLLLTDNYAKLSKDAKRFLYDVVYSRGWRSDITQSLQSDLHNANKSLGGVYGRAVVRLVTIMNKKKIGNVAALFDYIHDKWEPIKEAHSKKAQERYSNYLARKTMASNQPYGYFISPTGKLIEVERSHSKDAGRIIREEKLPIEDELLKGESKLIYDYNYIRISLDYPEAKMYIEGSRKCINAKTLDAIKKLFDMIGDQFINYEIELRRINEQGLFDDAIYKDFDAPRKVITFLRYQVTTTAGMADEYGYMIDGDGELFPTTYHEGTSETIVDKKNLRAHYNEAKKDAPEGKYLYYISYILKYRGGIRVVITGNARSKNILLNFGYGAVTRKAFEAAKKLMDDFPYTTYGLETVFRGQYYYDNYENQKVALNKLREHIGRYSTFAASTEPYGYLIDRDGNVIETDDHAESARAWVIKHGLQNDATLKKNLLPREYFIYAANGIRISTGSRVVGIEISKNGITKKAYIALENLLKTRHFEEYQLEIANYTPPKFDDNGNKLSNAKISEHDFKICNTDKELLRAVKPNVMKNETTAVSNTDWMNPKAYGYWIKPTGKVMQVYHESHFEEAQDMVSARGFRSRNDLAFQSSVIFSASVLGCVKVTTITSYDKKTRRVFLYFGEKGLSSAAFYEVRDLLKNGGFNEYIIDLAPDIMAKANTGKGLERADFWDNRSFDNHIATDDYLEAMRFVMKHKNTNPSDLQKACWFGTESLVPYFKSDEEKKKESEDDDKLLRDLEASAMVIDKSPRWVLERIRAPYLLVFQIKTTRSFIKPIPGWLVSNRFTNLNGFKRFYMYKYMGVMDQRRLDLETRLAVRRIARMNGFKISLGYDRVAIVTPEQFVAKEAVIKPFAIDWDSGKPLKRRNYLTKTFGDFQLSKELMQFWGITRRTKFTTKPPSYLVNYQGLATLEKAIGDKFDSLYRKQVRKIVFSIKAKYSTIIKSYDDKKSAVDALERVLDIIQQEACMNGIKYDAEREYHKNKKFRDRIFRRNFSMLETLIYKQLVNRLNIEPVIKKAVFGE